MFIMFLPFMYLQLERNGRYILSFKVLSYDSKKIHRIVNEYFLGLCRFYLLGIYLRNTQMFDYIQYQCSIMLTASSLYLNIHV